MHVLLSSNYLQLCQNCHIANTTICLFRCVLGSNMVENAQPSHTKTFFYTFKLFHFTNQRVLNGYVLRQHDVELLMFVVADVEPRNSHIANEYWIHVQNCVHCIGSAVCSLFPRFVWTWFYWSKEQLSVILRFAASCQCIVKFDYRFFLIKLPTQQFVLSVHSSKCDYS